MLPYVRQNRSNVLANLSRPSLLLYSTYILRLLLRTYVLYHDVGLYVRYSATTMRRTTVANCTCWLLVGHILSAAVRDSSFSLVCRCNLRSSCVRPKTCACPRNTGVRGGQKSRTRPSTGRVRDPKTCRPSVNRFL